MEFLKYLKEGFLIGIKKLQCINTYKSVVDLAIILFILLGSLAIVHHTVTSQFGYALLYLMLTGVWISNLGNTDNE